MKALVTIAFALEVDDEDDLTVLARNLDESLYQAVVKGMHTQTSGFQEFVTEAEGDGKIDWYGATIALKRSVFDGIESE